MRQNQSTRHPSESTWGTGDARAALPEYFNILRSFSFGQSGIGLNTSGNCSVRITDICETLDLTASMRSRLREHVADLEDRRGQISFHPMLALFIQGRRVGNGQVNRNSYRDWKSLVNIARSLAFNVKGNQIDTGNEECIHRKRGISRINDKTIDNTALCSRPISFLSLVLSYSAPRLVLNS